MLSYAYAGIDAASWNDRVIGAALVAAAVIRIVTPVDITVLGLLIAGLGGWWLVAAPFVFSYDGAPRAAASDLAVGAVVILLAVAGLVLRRRSARATCLFTPGARVATTADGCSTSQNLSTTRPAGPGRRPSGPGSSASSRGHRDSLG